jgi:hypothetical protein
VLVAVDRTCDIFKFVVLYVLWVPVLIIIIIIIITIIIIKIIMIMSCNRQFTYLHSHMISKIPFLA